MADVFQDWVLKVGSRFLAECVSRVSRSKSFSDFEQSTNFRWNRAFAKSKAGENGAGNRGKDLSASTLTADAHADYPSWLNIVNFYLTNV